MGGVRVPDEPVKYISNRDRRKRDKDQRRRAQKVAFINRLPVKQREEAFAALKRQDAIDNPGSV